MPAKIIDIESGDAGGKSTQVNVLSNYLSLNGLKFKHFHFPMYGHNNFSQLISMFLRGDFGSSKKISPYFVANIFGMDRWMFLPELEKHMQENDFIILDRYVFSNVAFQAAKTETKEEALAIKDWILKFEFEFLKLPYPDLIVFLNNPLDLIEQRLKERHKDDQREYLDGKKDIHEIDIELQKKVINEYAELMWYPNFKIIDCVQKNEETLESVVLTPSEVFESYKFYVDKLINQIP